MKRTTAKHALLMSVISLLLCVSMLVGTTFAWFTDEVTSSNNIIKSGNLDVEMYWADGTKAVPTEDTGWTDASAGAIFNYDLWEPGYTQVRHIKIANVGSLALKYKVSILANGEVSDLADVIDVYYVDPAVQVANRSALTDDNKLGTLTEVLAKLGETGNGELIAGTSDIITIAFKMQETAGNKYMNKAIGTDFSVVLNATQLTAESDSFDNQYDAGTANPVLTNPVILPESGPMTIGDNSVEATLSEGLVSDLRNNTSNEPTSKLYMKYAEPKIDTANKTIVFDYADIVDQDGNVVDLEAMGNNKLFTVKLYVGKTFAEGDKLEVFHDGEAVATPTVDKDGYIAYEVCHFCKIDVSINTDPDPVPVVVSNVEELLDALDNATPGSIIDATGVTIDINDVGYDLPTGKKAVSIPGGVTIQNLTVVGSYRGGNTLHFQGPAEQEIVFENCTFELSGRSMAITFLRAEDGVNSVVYSNCTFKGAVVLEKENGVATYNNCTFTKHPGTGSSYVMAYGGTHYFKGCTFDYTGLSQSNMGTINTASINSVSESDGSNTTEVFLEGCTLINCGTRKYGSNSTLTIK